MIPESIDGFHHNYNQIARTTQELARIIDMKRGQKTMDVGYGTNLAVAVALHELGMDAYGLDSRDGLVQADFTQVIPRFNAMQHGIKTYCGTIEDILHPESELKDQRFDLFTFWGSWASGGNNFAIGGEMAEFRAVTAVNAEYPTINPFSDCYRKKVNQVMIETKNRIMPEVKSLLNRGGGIMVVSSRYAGHGAGFTTDQLSWEKKIMLDLVYQFARLGATEQYLVGLSKEDVRKQIGHLSDIVLTLTDDSVLFGSRKNVYEQERDAPTLTAIREMNVPLGRIDAVYAKF
jgi:hypothetical protein